MFNQALALKQEQYDQEKKNLSYNDTAAELIQWKQSAETSWLREIHSQILQQSLKNLDRAYTNFFQQRADFPKFKRKGIRDSFRYPQGVKLEPNNNRIYLPKIGLVRYRNSREALGKVKNVTVSGKGGHWLVSVQTEREVETVKPTATSAVGIDMGIVRFATLSDGSYIKPLNSFKKHQQRLALYQRRMSRKVKFSGNWKKAQAKVQKIHIKIAHARNDFLHQSTAAISKNHALVCIEDLQVQNMSKSAKGNAENPGKCVKQKSGLNRSILEQGWFEFRRQLTYKTEWNGGILLAVPPQNTSRTCPCCGQGSKDNRKTQARFVCTDCGYENNADTVGAINVLERGHRLLAGGEPVQSGRSVKPEPAEASQSLRLNAVGISDFRAGRRSTSGCGHLYRRLGSLSQGIPN